MCTEKNAISNLYLGHDVYIQYACTYVVSNDYYKTANFDQYFVTEFT